MHEAADTRTRCYRHFADGTRVLVVRRPEDAVWHAERVRNDGVVVDWAYGPTRVEAIRALDLVDEWQAAR